MSRPEDRETTTVHPDADLNQASSGKRPLIGRLRRSDKFWLDALLCIPGSMGLSLILTGHHIIGGLVAGASATIYAIEKVIELKIDPKK